MINQAVLIVRGLAAKAECHLTPEETVRLSLQYLTAITIAMATGKRTEPRISFTWPDGSVT